MAKAKLVKTKRGVYVDRGDGRKVLVARPGRANDENVLKSFGLHQAPPEQGGESEAQDGGQEPARSGRKR